MSQEQEQHHQERPPVLQPGQSYERATDQIAAAVLQRTPRFWWIGFSLFFLVSLGFFVGVGYLFEVGIGVFGVNIPIAWGFPIINVVWWIGIGHAGTLISAILLLLHQKWRNSINRFAEAMTIFAAGIAGLYPVLHLGRPWFAYWLVPYPNTMGVWPQFRSPLVWDFFAIFTYITLSIIFWYMGMIPDLASIRDRARGRMKRVVYGLLSLGWRGSARHWEHYETAYLLLAGLATPLVVSVHSVISLDFAVSIVPGYHSTIFPPYFVAGALYSGFAMVLTLAVPLRHFYKLHPYITARHLDNAAKLMLAAGLVVDIGYVSEVFTGWYTGSEAHRYMLLNRFFGPYAWSWWTVIALNAGVLQLLWIRKVRYSPITLWLLSLLFNAAMWLERYMIVITPLNRDYTVSMWDTVDSTVWDWMVLIGSIGLFFTLMFLFIRFLPLMSAYEVKELLHEKRKEGRS